MAANNINPNTKTVRSISKEEFEQLIEQKLTRQQIADKFGVSRSLIDHVFKEMGLRSKGPRHKLHIDETVFDVIDTEEKAYWAGFIFSDGCIGDYNGHKRVALKLGGIDRDHVVKFKHFLGDHRDDNIYVRKEIVKSKDKTKEYEEYLYVAYNEHLANALIKIGCTPRKSLTLKFPDENIFAKKELVYDFIRGYLDGDGSICTESKHHKFIQVSMLGTYDFLSGVRKYLPQFSNIYKAGKIWFIQVSHKKGDQVAYKLYENATVYLSRKYLKYTTLCRLHSSEKLDKIGESCDANAEVTPEIAKGSESTVENSE